MRLIYVTFLVVLMLHLSIAGKKATKDLGNDVIVVTSLTHPTEIQFAITLPESYWIRFEFGSNAGTTDGFTISGEYNTIEDQFKTEDSEIQTDLINNYKMKVSGSGIKTFTVTRKLSILPTENLNSLERSDFDIQDGELNIVYSYGNGTSYSDESILSTGLFTLMIKSKVSDAFLVHNLTRKLDGEGSSDDILLHGLFTYIAWDIFSVLLILSGRYSKYFYSFRIYMHTIIGILTLIFNIIGVGFGSGESDSVNALGDSHESLSGIVTAWTITTCVVGTLIKIFGIFFGRLSFLSFWTSWVHTIIAYALIVYSQFALLSGLYYYDSPVTYLFYIHVSVMIIILIIAEVFWRITWNWKYVSIDCLEKKNLPEMSVEDFHSSEKNLVLFDQYVLDLGLYFMDHPGGKYVLDECRKKEVGKFFYGSFSLDDSIKVYRHSFIAGRIVIKLAVAKLIQPENILTCVTEQDQSNINLNASFNKIIGINRIYKVDEKEELFNDVYRVKFSNGSTLFKIKVPGPGTFGKHYIINSLKNEVCRYYTICNAMNSESYDKYLKIFGGEPTE
jgi:hypothetical protein